MAITIVSNEERIAKRIEGFDDPNIYPVPLDRIEPGSKARLQNFITNHQLSFQEDGLSETAIGFNTAFDDWKCPGISYTNLSAVLNLSPATLLVALEREGLATEVQVITEYPNGLHILWNPVPVEKLSASIDEKISSIKNLTDKLTAL